MAYRASDDYYTGLQMSGLEVEQMKQRAFVRHMRRSLWLEWKALPWWKRLFVARPVYESPIPLFIPDDEIGAAL